MSARPRHHETPGQAASAAQRWWHAAGVAAAIPRTTNWCDQCERRVTREEASRCASRWCSVKGSA